MFRIYFVIVILLGTSTVSLSANASLTTLYLVAHKNGSAYAFDDTRVVSRFDHGMELKAIRGLSGRNQVLTLSIDGTVKIWDALTGALAQAIRHDGNVRRFDYDQINNRLFSAVNRTMHVTDLNNGREIKTVALDAAIYILRVDSMKNRLIVASRNTVTVWELSSLKKLFERPGFGVIGSVTWTRDGDLLVASKVSVDLDGKIHLLSGLDGHVKHEMNDISFVHSAFELGEGSFLSVNAEGDAKKWSRHGELLHTFPTAIDDTYKFYGLHDFIPLSGDRFMIAGAGFLGAGLALWNGQSGTREWRIAGNFTKVHLSVSGHILIPVLVVDGECGNGFWDGVMMIELSSGRKIRELPMCYELGSVRGLDSLVVQGDH